MNEAVQSVEAHGATESSQWSFKEKCEMKKIRPYQFFLLSGALEIASKDFNLKQEADVNVFLHLLRLAKDPSPLLRPTTSAHSNCANIWIFDWTLSCANSYVITKRCRKPWRHVCISLKPLKIPWAGRRSFCLVLRILKILSGLLSPSQFSSLIMRCFFLLRNVWCSYVPPAELTFLSWKRVWGALDHANCEFWEGVPFSQQSDEVNNHTRCLW